MTLAQKLGLGLAVLLVGAILLQRHDAAVTARALAEQRADSLDQVRRQLDSMDVVRTRERTARDDSIAKLVTKGRHLRHRADVFNRRTDSLLLTLDSMVPRQDVLEIVALKDSTILAQRDQITSLHGILTFRGIQLATADSAVAEWRSLAWGAQLQLKEALGRANPRFACVGGPAVAGGFGGPAVGLGFACGLRL